LLELSGKPMVQWVLDALTEAKSVNTILVIGLDAGCGVASPKLKDYLPNQGSMLENIRAGIKKVLEFNPDSHHVVVVSSDIPAITAEMVDWVVDAALKADVDLCYNVITRQVMEARFPNSKRTYTHLKGIEVCGGDMNVIHSMTATGNDALWERIIAARKNAFKQASLFGWDTLFLLLFRAITIDDAVQRITQRVNLTGRAVICPYAEVGMDIDKPHQLEILRADLASKLALKSA
jgi:GTP:adenosylcobinamide-phosphate guanylyltransferase